ncbi:MAG: Orn/Lys/Arg decarboxylase N-terminal domain-containing protein [Methanoregula sp.]|jgi:hypothetical protein
MKPEESLTVAIIDDARAAYSALPDIDCILINWNLGGDTPDRHLETAKIIDEIRERNEKIPLFLMGEPTNAPPTSLPLKTVREVNEYIWVMEDTPEFIAGRITAAAKRYRENLLPPFFKELVKFSKDFEYSWHTPGHAGGTAFRKSPAGRAFFNFFGEQLFPGFEHDTHGIENVKGKYMLYCIKENVKEKKP